MDVTTNYSQTSVLNPQAQPVAGKLALPMRHARTWMAWLLISGDIVALATAYLLAVQLRVLIGASFTLAGYANYLPLLLLFPAVYWWRGLYPAIGLGAVEELRRLSISSTLCFVSIAAVTFLIQAPPVFSRLTFLLAWTFTMVAVPLGRATVRFIWTHLHLWGEPVAIIGTLPAAEKVVRFLQCYPKIGLLPVMILDSDPGNIQHVHNIPVYPLTNYLPRISGTSVHSALVIYQDLCEIDAIRETYQDIFQRVTLVSHSDSGLRFSGMHVREFGEVLGLEVKQNLLDHWAQRQKRCMDLILSGIGLVFLAPILGVLVLLIRLTSPGPVVYTQSRIGKGGKAFKVLKFRTMYANADVVLKEYLANDTNLQHEWQQYQKLKHDPRITPIGHLLRRFSLDELPQLWNVVRGEMSLVGPRPMMPQQRESYGVAFNHYIRVTPGMTGLWQISGRNKTTFARRADLDVQYVMNWSIWLDIYILCRTVWVVIRRDGAC